MYKILSCEEFSSIGLQEMKNCLKISHDDDDEFIKNCIKTSVEIAENFLNLALRSKVVKFSTSYVKKAELPILPFAELQSVTCDEDVTKDCYISQDEGSIIFPFYGKFSVIYACGFADNALPFSLRQGILAHTCAIFDRQIIDSDFLNQIFNFYKPFRRILI
jgi:hypothetical protein